MIFKEFQGIGHSISLTKKYFQLGCERSECVRFGQTNDIARVIKFSVNSTVIIKNECSYLFLTHHPGHHNKSLVGQLVAFEERVREEAGRDEAPWVLALSRQQRLPGERPLKGGAKRTVIPLEDTADTAKISTTSRLQGSDPCAKGLWLE